ncbi:RNA polymerase sigma factor [Sorangium sp. So ce513]|uniref:RNA polymerase sigma factor n=1 Tax=Sorangium sp. So ce513 TaxID=3133315 RepID=UPI003F622DB1
MTDSPPRRPSPAPAHDAGPESAAAPPPPPPPPPPPSFEEVYTSLLPYVLRVLWRMGVPARNLRDVAQEVFLVVHRRFEECDPRLSIKAWVASIASHLALRHQRLAGNRRELLARSEAELIDVADPGGDTEALCARAETQRIVRALVQRLEEDRRAVFILYELEGLDMRSIAGALQISENTAWDRLRRARKDLAAAVRRLCARDRDALGVYGARLALAPLALVDGPLLLELGDARLDLPEDLGAPLWARLQGLLAPGEGEGGEGSAPSREAVQAFPPDDGALEEVAAAEASRAAVGTARVGFDIARSKLVAAGAALFLAGAGAGSGVTHALGSRAAPPEVALAHGGALAAVAAVAGGPVGVSATAARVDATMPAAPMAPVLASPAPAAPAPASPAPVAPAPASPAPAAPAPASPAPAAPPPARLASTVAALVPPAATGAMAALPPLDVDLTLIQRAIAALGAGQAAEALDALDRHARSYPRSARAQQRETLAIQALEQLGRRAEAAARAARFRAAFPGSAYLPVIENALNGSP